VLNQTFQDYELIIIDDGSVDSTPCIARAYGQRVKDARQDNTGVAGALCTAQVTNGGVSSMCGRGYLYRLQN